MSSFAEDRNTTLIAEACGVVVLCLVVLVMWVKRKKYGYKGRWAVVTGYANGIGFELTNLLLEHQINVLGIDVSPCDALPVLMRTADSAGAELKAASANVCDTEALYEICDEFEAETSNEIAFLFNNAGIVRNGSVLDIPIDDVREVLEVNVISHYQLVQAFLPLLANSKSSTIVCTGSLLGRLAGADLSAYCASKWALTGFMESLRFDLDNADLSHIKTCSVHPYAVRTQMFDGIFEGAGDNWIRRTFFPLLKPIDVAHAVFHAAVHGYTTYYYPRFLGVTAWMLLACPALIREYVMGLMGGRAGMANFRGRPRNGYLGSSGVSTTGAPTPARPVSKASATPGSVRFAEHHEVDTAQMTRGVQGTGSGGRLRRRRSSLKQ